MRQLCVNKCTLDKAGMENGWMDVLAFQTLEQKKIFLYFSHKCNFKNVAKISVSRGCYGTVLIT